MLGTGRRSILLTISACSLILVTAAMLWAVTTHTSHAGDTGRSLAYAYSTHASDAFLGVELREETESSEGGARIERVVEDSAAEEAGLQEGDIIIAFDGRTVRGPLAVTEQIEERDPGDHVSITVMRDGRERSFDVELGKRAGLQLLGLDDNDFLVTTPGLGLYGCDDEDDDCSFSWSCAGDDCEGLNFDVRSLLGRRPVLGVQLADVTDELREHLGGERGQGTLVSRIVAGSPAEESGIEVGDLIVAVDGEPIEDAGDIRAALEDKEGETFAVDVIRAQRPVRVDVTIPERDDDVPSGPRARFFVAPQIELQGLHELIDGALDEAREALRESRASYRNALDHARVAQRDAARDARTAYRRALKSTARARLDRANSI